MVPVHGRRPAFLAPSARPARGPGRIRPMPVGRHLDHTRHECDDPGGPGTPPDPERAFRLLPRGAGGYRKWRLW